MPRTCAGTNRKQCNKPKSIPAGNGTEIMQDRSFLRRGQVCGALVIAGLFVSLPAAAQAPGPMATPGSLSAPSSASGSPVPPACIIPPDQARFDYPLPHTARLLAAGKPIKIVALGSSSACDWWLIFVIAKMAKPTVEISDKVRVNLEKFVWSSREK